MIPAKSYSAPVAANQHRVEIACGHRHVAHARLGRVRRRTAEDADAGAPFALLRTEHVPRAVIVRAKVSLQLLQQPLD